MVEFRVLCRGSRSTSRVVTLNFRRTNFGLFKDLPAGIPWVRALEGKGVQESWLLLYFTSSGSVYHQKRQESCVDEQGASSETQMGMKSLWYVGRGTGHLGEI